MDRQTVTKHARLLRKRGQRWWDMLSPTSSPRVASPSPRTTVLLLATGGLLAFFFWTVPNWPTFLQALGQWPSLRSLPVNRFPLIMLGLKILSPALVITFIGSGIGMYREALTPSPQRAVRAVPPGPAEVHHMLFKAAFQATAYPPPLAASSQTHPGSSASSSRVLADAPTRPLLRLDPITPLPPTLLPNEADTRLPELPQDAHERPFTASSSVDEHNDQDMLTPDIPLADEAGKEASELAIAPMSLAVAPSAPIIIHLLKEVSIMIYAPGYGRIEVPFAPQSKRVQLLAYIAWRRGEMIDREKILEQVFGWGVADEDASEEKLAERFESHKKLLRKKLREVVIEQINTPAGTRLIDPDIDPFVSEAGLWGLSGVCVVEDLEAIEVPYQIIAQARKAGKLVEEIPASIKEACDQLLAAYPGDFLEDLIKTYPGEFHAFQGRSSWVRKPFTQFRDYYLEALWYAAEYEWQQGQRDADPFVVSGKAQQEHYGRAAQLYQTYAMDACTSKYDTKVTFGTRGESGERVIMSERAVRRCVVIFGMMGKTELVDQIWSAYVAHMRRISEQRWTPSKETVADVEAARAQTSAYRFSAAFGQRQGRQEEEEVRE